MTPHSLSKAQLALLYAPNLTQGAAVNRLMAWLHRDEATMQKLYASGYYKTQKVFTSRQVAIIIDFLGEP